jgi:hypothetical protein
MRIETRIYPPRRLLCVKQRDVSNLNLGRGPLPCLLFLLVSHRMSGNGVVCSNVKGISEDMVANTLMVRKFSDLDVHVAHG